MTQDELAERIFTTKQTIHKYETGIVTNIPSDKIELLANVFNVSPVYLMAWDNESAELFKIEKKRFPLLGEIACGEPIFCNEDRESYVMAGTDIDADFCLKARGDSMINASQYFPIKPLFSLQKL